MRHLTPPPVRGSNTPLLMESGGTVPVTDTPVYLDLLVEEAMHPKEALPCEGKNHDSGATHSGPGYYWLLSGHPCFFNGRPHEIRLFCKSSVEAMFENAERNGGRASCPKCSEVLTLRDIFIVLGTVND